MTHQVRLKQKQAGNTQPTSSMARAGQWLLRLPLWYWRKGLWQKIVTIGLVLFGLLVGTMYGIAVWYQHEQKSKPVSLGVTFIADYATYLGLDAHQTYQAILNDMHPARVRLVSYWADIEPVHGQYDFSELDYEMSQAQAHGTKVTLAIGLRQPRWPECHAPGWIDTTKPDVQWQQPLDEYMRAVIDRYKTDPALESYQLENEYFNHFGACYNFDRHRLTHELGYVHQLDPHHPVIISRSNNYAGLALRQPLPDIVGVSVYRRVWNTVGPKMYFQYPFPSWYYAFLAGSEQIFTGKPAVIHELQTEPWPPNGKNINQISLSEQNKTFDATRLQTTVAFAKQTGMKHIDLWGAEYWYYRMTVEHDPSVWNTAEHIFNDD